VSDHAPIAEIKALLQLRVRELVERVLPTARISGGYASVSSSKPGADGGSLVVWIRGTSPGAWKDYATGDKGDILDLIAFAQFGHSTPPSKEARAEALRWARGFLGLADMPPVERNRARAFAEKKARERAESDQERALRNQKRAFEMWLKAVPLAEGAPARSYLAGRGIPLASIQHLEGDLRFAPALEWWMGARRDSAGRKIEPGPSFPAIVSAMRNRSGALLAVHCTFLAPDGSGKAPVAKPKLMWPATKGCVIRIAKGASATTPEEAAAVGQRDLVVLTEGIEDGLSIALVRPDLRVWACGSLVGIGSAPVLPCVKAFIVCADNDWHSAQAMAGLERAVENLRLQGVPVSIARSPTGKDFNDCLREGGAA
jgi:hypothetical protein